MNRCNEQAPRTVCERSIDQMSRALDNKARKEFYHLINQDVRFQIAQVHRHHRPMEDKSFAGCFINNFGKKVIYNYQNTDWTNERIKAHASIFPFKVSNDVTEENLEIFNLFDENFENQIRLFVDEHFDGIDAMSMVKLFLQNVYQHYKENTSKKTESYDLEKAISNLSISDNTQKYRAFHSLPKLKKEGVDQFLKMYNITEKIFQIFSPAEWKLIKFDKYDSNYFINLPEINFVQLYSLLNGKFYKSDFTEYLSTTKKYLFFFIHALSSELKLEFFIDDLLFECLKKAQKLKKSRESAVRLKSEIGIFLGVWMRCWDVLPTHIHDFDEQYLREVEKFFISIPSLGTAKVDFPVNEYNTISLCTEKEAYKFCFSQSEKDKPINFIDLIISVALSPFDIKKLSIYNAYLGTLVSIPMPKRREDILKFFAKYNTYDPTKEQFREHKVADEMKEYLNFFNL